nr:PREDICTED: sickle tail protein homolog [Equus przewalskii]
MEENESQKCEPCRPYSADSRQMQEQGKSNLHGTLEDAECRRTKERLPNANSRVSGSKSSRNIPRRHTLGGPRSSKEILGMQTSEMDRKREAFLEHLKQKYPHHATAIMGHQERLRDQKFLPGGFWGQCGHRMKHPHHDRIAFHHEAVRPNADGVRQANSQEGWAQLKASCVQMGNVLLPGGPAGDC